MMPLNSALVAVYTGFLLSKKLLLDRFLLVIPENLFSEKDELYFITAVPV